MKNEYCTEFESGDRLLPSGSVPTSIHSERDNDVKLATLVSEGILMKRDLAVLALILLTGVAAMGQGKKNPPMPPAPPPREDPMKSPHRLLVSILPSGKILLNDKDVADTKRLGEILENTFEERQLFRREVIFRAPPEMKYGELMAVLDVIVFSGGSPILVYIENLDDYVRIAFTGVPEGFRGLSVNLPLVVSSAPTPVYRKYAAVVTIPKTGIYVIRGVEISSGDEGYELTLSSQIGVAMSKLGTEDPSVLYVNCDKEALYSDLQRLIIAARAHTMMIDLWVKSKPGWQPMGVHRPPRRRNRRK